MADALVLKELSKVKPGGLLPGDQDGVDSLPGPPWGPPVSPPAPNFRGQRDKDIEATAVAEFIFSSFFHTGGRNYIALGTFKQLQEHYTGTGNGHNGLTILHSKINNHFFRPPEELQK